MYSELYASAGDPVVILAGDLKIFYANPAAQKLYKILNSAPQRIFIKSFLTSDSFLKLTTVIKHIHADKTQRRLELETVIGNKEKVATEITVFPLMDHKDVRGYHLTFRDIGQERQIQELVRESQKMEALQYFVSGTTKEIQHPLLVILKRIESIESQYRGRSFEYVSYKEFANIMHFFEDIRKQVKACYETTAKLTNLNKKRLKFESQHCQANDIIREVTRLKEKSLKNINVKFRWRLADKLPMIALGEIELNQIVSQLMDNAAQSMPGGGHLTVLTASISGGHEVRIDIADEGVGIAPEDLSHIFEPFFTTKQLGDERRVGLGLSIVYSLVKAAHGQIKVKSSLRKGTTVQLTFPVAEKS